MWVNIPCIDPGGCHRCSLRIFVVSPIRCMLNLFRNLWLWKLMGISIVHQSMSMNSVVLHSLDFCSMDKMVGGYLGRLRFCSPFDGLSGFVAVDLRCCMLRQAAGWVLPLAIFKEDILSKVFYFKSALLPVFHFCSYDKFEKVFYIYRLYSTVWIW